MTQGEAATVVAATITAQEANIAAGGLRGRVRLREVRERQLAMHPRERHPVSEVVLQFQLVAVVGVADSNVLNCGL